MQRKALFKPYMIVDDSLISPKLSGNTMHVVKPEKL